MAAPQWWNEQWNYRLPVTVDSGLYERTDYLVQQNVSPKDLLPGEIWKQFDPNSVRVVENDDEGEQTEIPSVFIEDKDSSSDGQGTLYWRLQGTTPTLTERNFYIYFDLKTNAPKTAPHYAEFSVTDIPTGNLLANANFEEGEGTAPANWTPVLSGDKATAISGARTDAEAKQGKYSLTISQKDLKSGSYRYLYEGWRPQVKVKPGQSYHISGWVKATGTGRQCIQLIFMDKEWKALPQTPTPYIIVTASNAHDWKEISGQIAAPPNAAFAGVRLYLYQSSGQAWFDELNLREVDPVQPVRIQLGALEKCN